MFGFADRCRLAGCFRPLILTDWTCARVFDHGDEAADALGTFRCGWHSLAMPFPLSLVFSILSVSIVANHSEKTDAGIEVHQRLAPYSASSILTSRMKPSVSAVNFMSILRDYSPLTTSLGMLLLPMVLMPTADTDDTFKFIIINQKMFVSWAQTLFFTTHLAGALRRYFTYRHLDLSLVANFYAQELWSAPCKYLNVFTFS